MTTPFAEKVYTIVRKIPAGKVMTYGEVAALVGNPRAARAVGAALHHNPYEPGRCAPELAVPCHRVVAVSGRLAPSFAFDGAEEQALRLRAEGVKVERRNGEWFVAQQPSFSVITRPMVRQSGL